MSEKRTGLPVDPTSSLVSQIASPFIPVEYETVRPYEVKSSEIDDMGGYTAYREIPGEYRITGFGTPPIVSGGIELFKQFMDDPTETAGGIASAVGTELKEYPARQLRTALSGGETLNPETGEIERFDPFAVPATVAAGTAVSIARTADKFGGGPVLGIMAGRNSASGASRENIAKELRRMGKSEDEIFRATQVYFDSDFLGGDTSAFRHEIPNTEKSTLKTGDISSPVSKDTGDFLYTKDGNSFGFKPDVQRYEYDPDAEDLFLNDRRDLDKIMQGDRRGFGSTPTLDQVFNFPELFKEYPQLKDVYVVGVEMPDMMVGEKTRRLGGFYMHYGVGGKPTIAMAQATSARDFQSSLLHEIQHAVQAIEHTPGGGEFRSIYDAVKDRLGVEGDSDYVMERAVNAYEALYGEVEARIVQKRFLDPELKKEVPIATRKREAPDDDLVENERDAVDALEEAIREELEFGDVSYEEVYPEQFGAGPKFQASLTDAPKSTGLLGGDKPQRFYHGTKAGFKEFDPDAKVTFVADDPETAGYYSDLDAAGSNIRPVYLKDVNFFDVDNLDHIKQLRESDWYKSRKEDLYGFSQYDEGDFVDAVEAGNYDAIEKSGLIDWIRSQGFDGFTTYEQYGKNYGVFNVENIVPGVAKKKEGGIVSLIDLARNTGRGPMGVASLSSTARNMNRPMVS